MLFMSFMMKRASFAPLQETLSVSKKKMTNGDLQNSSC